MVAVDVIIIIMHMEHVINILHTGISYIVFICVLL